MNSVHYLMLQCLKVQSLLCDHLCIKKRASFLEDSEVKVWKSVLVGGLTIRSQPAGASLKRGGLAYASLHWRRLYKYNFGMLQGRSHRLLLSLKSVLTSKARLKEQPNRSKSGSNFLFLDISSRRSLYTACSIYTSSTLHERRKSRILGFYHSRRRSLSVTAVLIPSTTFLGLLSILWLYKSLMLVIFQNKIIYMPSVPPFSRSEKLADYAAVCRPVTWREERIRAADGVELALAVGESFTATEKTSEKKSAGLKQKRVVVLYFQGSVSLSSNFVPQHRIQTPYQTLTECTFLRTETAPQLLPVSPPSHPSSAPSTTLPPAGTPHTLSLRSPIAVSGPPEAALQKQVSSATPSPLYPGPRTHIPSHHPHLHPHPHPPSRPLP